MKPAVYDTMTIDIETLTEETVSPYLFRATGSTLRFAGFLKVYGVDADAEAARPTGKKAETKRDKNADNNQESMPENEGLPDLQKGDWLDLHQLVPKQHFTQPPARYTEAQLIGALKKQGLGRPSTYATIIDTLKKRRYVLTQQKRLHPTALGFQVCELLEQHLDDVVDVDFTAQMETDLDAIAHGQKSRLAVMRAFYEPFKSKVDQATSAARQNRQAAALPAAPPYGQKKGGSGKRQPRKRAAKPTRRPGKSKKLPQSAKAGQPCPACEQGELVVRSGKFGPFLGCTRFQQGCKYTEPVEAKA
jgi:DNA topoisomerase-1